LVEKSFFAERGIATAPFAAVDSLAELEAAVARIGERAVLKTRRFGYDGKGQMRIGPGTSLGAAWEAIGKAPAIREGHIDFGGEVSVVAARGLDGQFAAFDLCENEHRNHILARTVVPAAAAETTAAEAIEIARRTAEALDVVGVFAVEMFVCEEDGR